MRSLRTGIASRAALAPIASLAAAVIPHTADGQTPTAGACQAPRVARVNDIEMRYVVRGAVSRLFLDADEARR